MSEIQRIMPERIHHQGGTEEYQIHESPERYARVLQVSPTGDKAWACYCLWNEPDKPGHTFCEGVWGPTREVALAAAYAWIERGTFENQAVVREWEFDKR